jgi:hypothetical protein
MKMETAYNGGTIEQFTANLMPVVFSQLVSKRTLEGLPQCELSSRLSYITEGMILSLRTYVAGNQTHVEVGRNVKRPRNWKEALKERFAPKWYLSSHPVDYEYIPVQICHYHMCPHVLADMVLPENKRKHFEWLNFSI